MGDFNWLHFSDLHLAPKDNFDSTYAKDRLFDFLKTETDHNRLPCDYIFISGDLAHKNDYSNVQDFFIKLFKALKWPPNKFDCVFWATGNHDISRKNVLRNLLISENLRIEKDKQISDRIFEEWMDDTDFTEILVSKGMRDFSNYYKDLFGREIYTGDKYPHFQYKLPNLNLVVLNTCLTSCDNNDKENLNILDSGFQNLFENLNSINPTFVMGHHGLEFFNRNTKIKLEHLFDSKNVALYLCGHSHELGVRDFQKAKRDIFEFTCGGLELGNYCTMSFMHGFYSNEAHEVIINPYSYSNNPDHYIWEWKFDNNLSRKLKGPIKLTSEKEFPLPVMEEASVENINIPVARVHIETVKPHWSRVYFPPSIKESKRSI